MKHANYPHFSCIDAENIPAFHGEEVLWNVNRFPGTTRIYGSKASLRNWQRVIEDYALESKQHRGGKQAADELILADAWNAITEEDIWHLVLVTNDGDFAPDMQIFRDMGCFIVGIGTSQAARALRRVCNSFILLEWN